MACIENHQNEGVHYPAAVRLSTAAGWNVAKRHLTEQHNVVVNIKESTDGGFDKSCMSHNKCT